jgi:hypothetical protein
LWRLGRFDKAAPPLREAVRLRFDAAALNARLVEVLRELDTDSKAAAAKW